jgi:lipoyl-dependent peroxiredoxin
LAELEQVDYRAVHASAMTTSPARLLIKRSASAVWAGNLQDGTGTLTTESGVLSRTPYSLRAPFAESMATNPDELIAASLGGCFARALAKELIRAGLRPERINAEATATLEELPAGWTITHIQLDVQAKVPSATQDQFIVAALAAKTACPIARVLNATISMTASLDRQEDGDGENPAIPMFAELPGHSSKASV